MDATEIVAKEQVLISLQKLANAKIQDALAKKETLINKSDRDAIDEQIKNFRTNCVSKIHEAIDSLTTDALGLASISESDWNNI